MQMYELTTCFNINGHLLPIFIFIKHQYKDNISLRKLIRISEFFEKFCWDISRIKDLSKLCEWKLKVSAYVEDPLWYYLSNGEYDRLRGFLEDVPLPILCFETKRSCSEEDNGLLLFQMESEKQQDYVKMLIHSGLRVSCRHQKCMRFHPAFTRLLRIICAIEVIRKTEGGVDPQQKVVCLKILFEFIRDPYITSAEVRCILRLLGCTSKNLRHKIIDVFETYFPESRQPRQPRSLKHLCRCQVRESLKAAGMYPKSVEMLHIPQLLKSYILIDYSPFIPRNCTSHIIFDLPITENGILRSAEFRVID